MSKCCGMQVARPSRFRRNFPGAQAECAAVEDSTFFHRTFDGIVAWGGEEMIESYRKGLPPQVKFLGVTLDTGSELISGSTRLKAGTAQKIALNTLSSAIMVRLNKVYGNLMVDLRPTNAKLKRRAVALTMLATGADEDTARSTLERAGYQVKVAILAISRALPIDEAQARLEAARGNLRLAMSPQP